MSSNVYIQCLITIVLMVSILFFESIKCVINFIGSALIVAIISWKITETVNRYKRQKRVISSTGKAVLITGCDSGFGNGLTFQLNRLGFHTIALCLDVNGDGVKQLIERVVFPNNLSLLQVDVTDDSMIEKSFGDITRIIKDKNLKLWALVNNAGVFHIGFTEWDNSIDGYYRVFNVNTLGTIRMTRKYLPLLRESGGRVVNVLSGASRISIEGVGAYSASKYASLAFNDSLRREMFRFGVKVISVEPSCYRTPIADNNSVGALLDRVWSQTPTDIRKDYGNECFKSFKLWYARQVNRARDPQEVVLAMTEAVVSESPPTRYRCSGFLVSIIGSMAELLPTEMFDGFWRTANQYEICSK